MAFWSRYKPMPYLLATTSFASSSSVMTAIFQTRIQFPSRLYLEPLVSSRVSLFIPGLRSNAQGMDGWQHPLFWINRDRGQQELVAGLDLSIDDNGQSIAVARRIQAGDQAIGAGRGVGSDRNFPFVDDDFAG